MTTNITTGIAAFMIALTFATFSPPTASADGHKKFLATNVIGMNVIGMNWKMAPKKSYTNSGATASTGGYKKFLPTNVIGMNVIGMNWKMAPKKSYTISRPTASAGGYNKTKFNRNVLVVGMNGRKATRK